MLFRSVVQEKATVVGQEEEERASSLATGAQGGKRPTGSPLPDLAEKKQRAIQIQNKKKRERRRMMGLRKRLQKVFYSFK